LLTIGVFANPLDKRNDRSLQDAIDDNDDQRNGASNDHGILFVVEIILTDWYIFIGLASFDVNTKVEFHLLMLIIFLTHALEGSEVIGFFILNLFGIVGFEFFFASSPEFLGVVFELLLFNFITLADVERISGLQHLTLNRALENDETGAAKHKDDNEINNHPSNISLSRRESAVFPNNVRWLRGFLKLHLATQK
jgi:hypothetical protein